MSNVINYFLGNTIYILTLTRSGDPDQHPALLEEVSPIMQWVFNDSDVAAKNPDIMLAMQLNDSEDDELYRIYISGFQKNGREWK